MHSSHPNATIWFCSYLDLCFTLLDEGFTIAQLFRRHAEALGPTAFDHRHALLDILDVLPQSFDRI